VLIMGGLRIYYDTRHVQGDKVVRNRQLRKMTQYVKELTSSKNTNRHCENKLLPTG